MKEIPRGQRLWEMAVLSSILDILLVSGKETSQETNYENSEYFWL